MSVRIVDLANSEIDLEMVMAGDNLISLVERLKARAAEKKNYRDHLLRISAARGILAKSIKAMRDAGVTESEIVGVLRHAADETRIA